MVAACIGMIAAQSIVAGTVFAHEIPWGLDRINQRQLPLDNYACFEGGGASQSVYVVGTGIDHSDPEFGGRASPYFDFEGGTGEDIHGSGTWAASIAGGANYGVAKEVQLYSVRVGNVPSAQTHDIIDGLQAIVLGGDASSSVVLIAIEFSGSPNTALDDAIRDLANAGFTVVIPAGDQNADACNISPARVAEAITVGATDVTDTRWSASNYGPCVDLFAPGVDIPGSTGAYSGTAAAAAHVAGALAVGLGSVEATPGVVSNPGTGSPNLLLYLPDQSDVCPPPVGCIEDIDKDGRVGFSDLTAVLNAWGDCP